VSNLIYISDDVRVV